MAPSDEVGEAQALPGRTPWLHGLPPQKQEAPAFPLLDVEVMASATTCQTQGLEPKWPRMTVLSFLVLFVVSLEQGAPKNDNMVFFRR